MMKRADIQQQIDQAFEVTPCVGILGPRQCGKTTEAKNFFKNQSDMTSNHYFDLENLRDIERLRDPLLTLSQLSGLIVIDEIQAHPDLFKTLRVLIDDEHLSQRYLVLGSASRHLLRQSSETLAGRISYLEMSPFRYLETKDQKKTWLRGGFPLSYLAKNENISFDWRMAYIKTYLEQDIPNLGIQIPAMNLRRFWMMLTHSQGNVFNASDIGRSLGLSHKVIQHYADILTGTFMVRQLAPWYENLSKRQVKSPKLYIRDTGIFHALLGIQTWDNLIIHPKLGASWESFAIEQVIQSHGFDPENVYFWGSHQGAELDLLVFHQGKRLGFEIKYSSAPTLTKSMKIATEDLSLDQLIVIYPGDVDYPLAEKISVKGFHNAISDVRYL